MITKVPNLNSVREIDIHNSGRRIERERIVAYLRSGEEIGGDSYVAKTIADIIERGEHWSA